MHKEVATELTVLRRKLELLLLQHESLKQLLHTEQTKVQQLMQELENEKNKQLVIAEQNKIAKLADALLASGVDEQDLIQAVGKHIRVVNTCIRLLSDR